MLNLLLRDKTTLSAITTNSTLLGLVLTDYSSYTQIKISNNADLSPDSLNANSGIFISVAASFDWVISNTNGKHKVYYQLKNITETTAIFVTNEIILDTIPPSAQPIDAPSSTMSPNIQITLKATDANSVLGVEVMIANSENFAAGTGYNGTAFVDPYWKAYIPPTQIVAWKLMGSINEYKNVYAKFRDKAGNVSAVVDTTHINATDGRNGIAYGDTTPPPKVPNVRGVIVNKNQVSITWEPAV